MTISERAQELLAARTPFVHATVVRAQPPTSAYPGDEAILLADGTIEGFVGGQCAQNSVRKAALGVLQAGSVEISPSPAAIPARRASAYALRPPCGRSRSASASILRASRAAAAADSSPSMMS